MVSKTKKALKKENSYNNENITIDAKHNEMIEKFKSNKKSIPSLKKQLHVLIDDYKKSKNNELKNTSDYIIERNQKKDAINELKNKIQSIMSNEDLNNYYLNVSSLLHNYYENIENYKNEEKERNLEIENLEEDIFDLTSSSKKKKQKYKILSLIFLIKERKKKK